MAVLAEKDGDAMDWDGSPGQSHKARAGKQCTRTGGDEWVLGADRHARASDSAFELAGRSPSQCTPGPGKMTAQPGPTLH